METDDLVAGFGGSPVVEPWGAPLPGARPFGRDVPYPPVPAGGGAPLLEKGGIAPFPGGAAVPELWFGGEFPLWFWFWSGLPGLFC